jgi:hypothetical protein
MSEFGTEKVNINQNKSEELLWVKGDAKVVGDFLSGKARLTKSSKTRAEIWRSLTTPNSLDPTQLLKVSENYTKDIPIDTESPSDREIVEGYEEMSLSRAKVLLNLTTAALEKFGLWPHSTRIVANVSHLRSKTASNFAQDNLTGEAIGEKGFLTYSEGGPNILSTIQVPRGENTARQSDERVRTSLGHEIGHNLRTLANAVLWEEYEEEAMQYGIKPARKGSVIGGFTVESSQLGAEGLGELSAEIIKYKVATGSYPTINELIPKMAGSIRKSYDRYKTKTENNPNAISDYLAGKLSLLDSMIQLSQAGYGNSEAINLAALAALGFVNFKKMPALIKLGIINQDKFQKMRKTVVTVLNWLTSPRENGFAIDPNP